MKTSNRLTRYEKGTNAKINAEKTKYLPLGPLRQIEKPNDINGEWITDTNFVTHLGIPVGNNPNLDQYWTELDRNISASIDQIRYKNFTVKGKSLLTKSLASSKIWYAAKHMIIPNSWIDKWQTEINKAHWPANYKTVVGWKTMIQPKHKGGMNATHIKSKPYKSVSQTTSPQTTKKDGSPTH